MPGDWQDTHVLEAVQDTPARHGYRPQRRPFWPRTWRDAADAGRFLAWLGLFALEMALLLRFEGVR